MYNRNNAIAILRKSLINLQIKFSICCCRTMIPEINGETSLIYCFVVSEPFFTSQTARNKFRYGEEHYRRIMAYLLLRVLRAASFANASICCFCAAVYVLVVDVALLLEDLLFVVVVFDLFVDEATAGVLDVDVVD